MWIVGSGAVELVLPMVIVLAAASPIFIASAELSWPRFNVAPAVLIVALALPVSSPPMVAAPLVARVVKDAGKVAPFIASATLSASAYWRASRKVSI